jgi:hypothetical protein
MDAAGNSATSPAVTMNIDTTGPTLTFQTSNVLDGRTNCTVTVNASTSDGTITQPNNPVTYTCNGTSTTDLSPGGLTLKQVRRPAIESLAEPDRLDNYRQRRRRCRRRIRGRQRPLPNLPQ